MQLQDEATGSNAPTMSTKPDHQGMRWLSLMAPRITKRPPGSLSVLAPSGLARSLRWCFSIMECVPEIGPSVYDGGGFKKVRDKRVGDSQRDNGHVAIMTCRDAPHGLLRCLRFETLTAGLGWLRGLRWVQMNS